MKNIDFLSDNLVQALGWTLVHSLWQIALVGIFLAILLNFMHKNSSESRYWTSFGALLMILVASVATFSKYFQFTSTSQSGFLAISENSNKLSSLIEKASENSSFLDNFTLYFQTHLPLLVTVWLLVVCMLNLRLLAGLAYTQRLKSYRTQKISDSWHEKMQVLAQKIGVFKAIQLRESAMVDVPMVIGHLKPVILLPLGAISGFSVSQIEGILAHELAHIRRNDFAVNLLQNVLENAFFFHPVLWWISSQIREERENCCDDIAVTVCGNSLDYVKALHNLAEKHYKPTLAMAFTGNSTILSRVKRILRQHNVSASFSEGFWTGLAFVGFIFLVTLNVEGNENPQKNTLSFFEQEPEKQVFKAKIVYLEDSLGKKRTIIVFQKENGEIAEIYIDGKKIPSENIKDYEKVIKESLDKTTNSEEQTTLSAQELEAELADISEPPLPELPEDIDEANFANFEDSIQKFEKIFEAQAKKMEALHRLYEKKMSAELEDSMQKLEKIFEQQANLFEQQTKKMDKLHELQAKKMEAHARKMEAFAQKTQKQAKANAKKMEAKHTAFTDEVRNYLLENKLIENKKPYQLRIYGNKAEVNDQAVSEEVLEKIDAIHQKHFGKTLRQALKGKGRFEITE